MIGAAFAAAHPTHAEEYSWQLSGVARRAETRNFDTDSWAVDGTYYAHPIDDGDGPFALASFLNPTTRVSAEANKTDPPFDLLDEPTAYTLSGAYVLPGQRWYIGASYAHADVDDTALFTRSESKGYGVEAGVYLGANTTLELQLGQSEQIWETALSCLPPVCLGVTPLDFVTTADSVGLEVFHLRRFRSLMYSLQGSVSESDPETKFHYLVDSLGSLMLRSGDGPPMRTYSVAGELFPTKTLGVRVGYTQVESEGYHGDSYDVAGTWFFKPRFAIQVGLSRASLELGPYETESATIRFIGRL